MGHKHNTRCIHVLLLSVITSIFLGTYTITTPASIEHTRACPCPDTSNNAGRPFIACNTLTKAVHTNQLLTLQSACLQGPVQFCSGISGLSNSVLEGLWLIGQPDQPANPGISTLQTIARTRAFNCTGLIITIDFNQQTSDPANAFTFLKTIQPGDSLQFTQIDSTTCEVIAAVNACAAASITGCGPVLSIPVLNASGLTALYNTVDDYVSLLNFGPKPNQAGLLSNTQKCTNCSTPSSPDQLCWPAQICTGLTGNFIPANCTSLMGLNTILLNADHLGAVTTIAVPKTTLGGFSVNDILCATRVEDRLRVYLPGISNVTPLNMPPGQLGWATALSGLFGASTGSGDHINDVAVDSQGNIIVVGFHTPPNTIPEFAAAQLVPSVDGQSVTIGWSTVLAGAFGGSTGNGDIANGVVIDQNDNIIIGGFHEPPLIGPQFAALQLDSGGGLTWATSFNPFGNPGLLGAQANDVILDIDGGIILAGFFDPVGGGSLVQPRFVALKLAANSSGTLTDWTFQQPPQLFGTVNSIGDQAQAAALDNNNTIILAGFHDAPGANNTRMAVLQLIPSGPNQVNLGWFTTPMDPFGTIGTLGDQARAVLVDCNNAVILAGLHDPAGNPPPEFAALQLKQVGTGVQLGWTTPNPFRPFGSVSNNTDGDQANDALIDHNNNIILAGFHTPAGQLPKFAALQLIPNASGSVDLGWTAVKSPFGTAVNNGDQANAVALQMNNNLALGGFHSPSGGNEEFATLQLRQPFIPAFGDFTIDAINEVGDFILFDVSLIQTESSTVCPNQVLCIENFGFCCS